MRMIWDYTRADLLPLACAAPRLEGTVPEAGLVVWSIVTCRARPAKFAAGPALMAYWNAAYDWPARDSIPLTSKLALR